MRSPLAFKPVSPAATTNLAVTGTTGSVALPDATPSQVRLWTVSTDAVCFIAFGDVTVVATTAAGMPFANGLTEVLSVPVGATYIAAITATGTATLYITPGEGI